MSFMKYLENKARPSILVVMDEYKEKLHADMASLMLKPDQQLIEARKNIVNIKDVSRTLSELAYPLSDEFKMAIRTGDPKRVNHAHMTFRRWVDYHNPDRALSDKIETAMFQYQLLAAAALALMHLQHSLLAKFLVLLLMLVVLVTRLHQLLHSLAAIHQQLQQPQFRVVKTNHLVVQQEQDI